MDVGETRGMMKVVVDARTNQILGAAIFGIEGGEVMTVVQVAMMGNLPYTALRDGVICHPTLAEGLHRSCASWTIGFPLRRLLRHRRQPSG